VVVDTSAWPGTSWKVRMSTPLSARWVAGPALWRVFGRIWGWGCLWREMHGRFYPAAAFEGLSERLGASVRVGLEGDVVTY
jgi:hypothetical protein